MYVDHDDTNYNKFIRKYMTENWSCRTDQNGQDVFQLIKDPRVTRVGAILRKTNLDELPQLFNVLKGEMSFVGPRPDIPFSVTMYQSHHFKRFDITPGITGLWQISGRKNLSFEDMVRLDFEYMKKQSLFLDIKIIFLTIGAILGKHPS
jgi:lipopolysaccharide/colanic/teichoic acid biosynthesis glycosyltransferase